MLWSMIQGELGFHATLAHRPSVRPFFLEVFVWTNVGKCSVLFAPPLFSWARARIRLHGASSRVSCIYTAALTYCSRWAVHKGL